MTISEAFAQYDLEALLYKGKKEKTRQAYKTVLNSFLNSNPDLPVQFIAAEHIALWERYMARQGNSLSTVASWLGRFRKVMVFLKKKKYSVMDPDEIELPKVKKKEVTFLYARQIQDMIDITENLRDKALIAMMFSSGARINELLSLNRDSISKDEFGHGEARIIGKGDKPGTINFDVVALRYLDDYLGTRKDRLAPLFVSGQRRRLGYARANQIIHEAADLAGVPVNVSTHVIRHSFATDLMFNGAHIMDIKAQLRHSDVSTTMRYLHVTDSHKKESYRKFHTTLK